MSFDSFVPFLLALVCSPFNLLCFCLSLSFIVHATLDNELVAVKDLSSMDDEAREELGPTMLRVPQELVVAPNSGATPAEHLYALMTEGREWI